MSAEQLLITVLIGAIQAAPDLLDVIERWVKGERAKRVDEVRTAPAGHSLTGDAIAALKVPTPAEARLVAAAKASVAHALVVGPGPADHELREALEALGHPVAIPAAPPEGSSPR